MINWFKKTPEVKPQEQKGVSFFTTDFANTLLGEKSLQERIAANFQRTIANLKPVDSNGNVVTSGMDSLDEQLSTVKALNNISVNVPDGQMAWYSSWGFIGYQTCAIMSQHWLVDKANSQPAKDAIRNGYEITVNDGTEVKPEVLETMAQYDKDFHVKRNCEEFLSKGRMFGVRHALFLVDSDDEEYYKKPFNIDGIKPGSYRGITQIDPYWIAPVLDSEAAANPASKHFYEPTWWVVNGKYIHRTHFVIFKTNEVADILKPTYYYGGVPLPQQIAERIYCAERTANEAPLLAFSKRLTTIKMDTTEVLGNQEVFEQHLSYMGQVRNNFGVQAVGVNEEVQQFDTSLADLDDVIMTQYQLVAGVARVPATKLLGTSPKGFNATGDYEEASYGQELESLQENDLTPLLDKHHELVIKSLITPKFGIEFKTSIHWLPTNSPTAGELAELNYKKSQTDATLANAGAINGEDIRNRLIADKDSGYNGIEALTEPMEEFEDTSGETTNE